ncbi:MAG TPA: hypothetical protein VFS42_11030 [Burkholderiaceae bacterium]|nr:hypothetical protein [Burkholderiaceae bacterium]
MGRHLTKFRFQGALGKNCRIEIAGANDIEVRGITFEIVNTPTDAGYNALETDMILRVQGGSNVWVSECDFLNSFGVPVNMRHLDGGGIRYCRAIGTYKDSFHITGTSRNILRAGNVVENGGDDAFPIVGYATGTGAGQPEGIVDIGNKVYGLKHARAFPIVGAKRVRNVGSIVDGLIPAKYGRAANEVVRCGVYIASESSFDTYGNEDILIDGISITNCGYASLYPIMITGRAGKVTRDIRIVNPYIARSATTAIVTQGASTGLVENLVIENPVIRDTTDPNGIVGTAGQGSGRGMLFDYTKDLMVCGPGLVVDETGEDGIVVNATNVGRVAVARDGGRISNVNKRYTIEGTPNAGRRPILIAANSNADSISIATNGDLEIVQDTATRNIDRLVENTNLGKTRWGRIYGRGVAKRVNNGTTATNITPTGSPFKWQNPNPYPVMVYMDGGSVSLVEKSPNDVNYGNVGHTVGQFYVEPGQWIRITYSSAPATLAWFPQTV